MKHFSVILLICVTSLLATGCGSGDVDPQAKVDAPGYYNGPVEGKKGASPAPSATPKKGGGEGAITPD